MIKRLAIGLIGLGCGLLVLDMPSCFTSFVLQSIAIVCVCHALFYDGPEID